MQTTVVAGATLSTVVVRLCWPDSSVPIVCYNDKCAAVDWRYFHHHPVPYRSSLEATDILRLNVVKLIESTISFPASPGALRLAQFNGNGSMVSVHRECVITGN
jgi:hypothetical protein